MTDAMIERTDMLARVASMYYEDNMTQDEIARQIITSRSTVSRMLQEAREAGVVEIVVHHPWKTNSELESDVCARFGLRQARVLCGEGREYQEILRGLGVLAARYIESILDEVSLFGISWGAAVYSTVQALRPASRLPITVVQMVGAVGEGDPLIDGPELARLLAAVCGGTYRYLHAPLIVEDLLARSVLLQEPTIRETLALACRAELALVGIGAPFPSNHSFLRAGYLDKDALAQLRSEGVVGDICGRHYDASGQEVAIELNRRIVGIRPKDLREIDRVIGVAGGTNKAEAILGALRGHYLDTLVTDDTTAKRLLLLSQRAAGSPA